MEIISYLALCIAVKMVPRSRNWSCSYRLVQALAVAMSDYKHHPTGPYDPTSPVTPQSLATRNAESLF